jgi:Major Facilitator Superfamily
MEPRVQEAVASGRSDVASIATSTRRLPALLRPLEERDYRLVWFGEGVSTFGDQFHMVALTWLTLGLTGSGLALGTVLTAAAVPRALLILVGGALSDRFPPRRIMLASNVLRGIVVGLLAALIFTGRVELVHVYVLAIIFGTVDAFFYPAIGAFTPSLVDDEARLPAANALFQGTTQLMAMVGPPLAGLVVAAATPGPAFAVDALSFAVAALMLALVRGRDARRGAPREAPEAQDSLLVTIRAGLAYAWRDRALRLLLLMATVVNVAFAGPEIVGLAWLAANRWMSGPIGYGLLMGAWALGALLGIMLAGSVGELRRQGRVFVAILAGLGLGLIVVGLSPTLQPALLVTLPMGVATGFINVRVLAWLQVRVDPALLGRVMSLVMLAGVGLAPLSYAVAGAVVDVDATALFIAAAALIMGTAAAGLVGGAIDRIDEPPELAPPG